MARNETLPLSGDALARSMEYARIVEGFMDGSGSTVVFHYTSRDGVQSDREATPVEIVGTPGCDTYGFKGETEKGPRTFNFHLMG